MPSAKNKMRQRLDGLIDNIEPDSEALAHLSLDGTQVAMTPPQAPTTKQLKE
jgi:hypothetical protein